MGDAQAIVNVLNEPPFSKKLNLIRFDAIQGLDLLQVFNDILAEISPENKMDLRDEEPEETLQRMLAMLRVVKYRPPGDTKEFRHGLIAGQKDILYHVMGWILPQVEAFKTRAYLARFLVRIDVPEEILTNDEVAIVYDKYTALLAEFKDSHKECDALKNSGFSGDDIRKDIVSMEAEHANLKRRTERMREKAKTFPKYDEMLAAAQALRQQHEREESLQIQTEDQQQMLDRATQKHERALQNLKEVRASSVVGGAEGLIDRIEQEHKMLAYRAVEKNPETIERIQRQLDELQEVAKLPSMFQDDLQGLQDQVRRLTGDINGLMEKRMQSQTGPGDDGLGMFRQQASIIASKKDAIADKLQEQQDATATLETELAEKKKVSKGPKMLKADEFKRYVAKLRSKSTTYKQKKSELGDLRSEFHVLTRTKEMLKEQQDTLQATVAEIEEKKGVSGYRETRDQLEEVASSTQAVNEDKADTLEEIGDMVTELTSTIASKKTALAPLITQLRESRAKAESLEATYDDKKATWEKVQKSMEGQVGKLETEVKQFRAEVGETENRYHKLNTMMSLLKVQQQSIDGETKLYTQGIHSMDADGKPKKTLKDTYNSKLRNGESLGKQLKEKQKIVTRDHDNNMMLLDTWRDLRTLMQCKVDVAAKLAAGEGSEGGGDGEEDRLVL